MKTKSRVDLVSESETCRHLSEGKETFKKLSVNRREVK